MNAVGETFMANQDWNTVNFQLANLCFIQKKENSSCFYPLLQLRNFAGLASTDVMIHSWNVTFHWNLICLSTRAGRFLSRWLSPLLILSYFHLQLHVSVPTPACFYLHLQPELNLVWPAPIEAFLPRSVSFLTRGRFKNNQGFCSLFHFWLCATLSPSLTGSHSSPLIHSLLHPSSPSLLLLLLSLHKPPSLFCLFLLHSFALLLRSSSIFSCP